MVQPSNRRFVMEDRLNSELSTIDSELATKANTADLPTLVQQLNQLDYAKFDTTYAGGSTQPGMIAWNDTDGTLEFQLKGGNVTLQIGQEQVVRVRNNTGSTLTNGKAVYITGSDGSNLRAAYANASSETTSSGTIGVTTEDIANGHAGYITTFGLVRDINTTGLTEGAPVWLSATNGGLTSTRPAAPNHGVMIGFCLRAHATTGSIFVRVDNGWELDELHNVLITSPSNGQALTYDSATGLWKNSTPASTLNDLTDVTINSGTLSGGQVIKYDAGTTQWVNGAAAGGVTASATAPNLATSAAGDAWFDTNDGTLYVCYVDADSTKQWVQVQANSALEGTILARLGSLETQAIAYGTQSPNYIINGAFDFWQRGTSISTSGGLIYTTDRWQFNQTVAAAMTISRQNSGLAGFQYCARIQRNSGVTAAPGVYFMTSLETANSVSLSGKTVTLSFYARAGANMSNTAIQAAIISGTGTDQSVGVGYTGQQNVAVSNITLTTSWQLFSLSGIVPSNSTEIGVSVVSGTVGTAGANDYYEITGVQLEQGSTVTQFRRSAGSLQNELLSCMRYYQPFKSSQEWGMQNNTMSFNGYKVGSTSFYTPMRVAPTVSTKDAAGNLNNITIDNIGYGSASTTNFSIDSLSDCGFRIVSPSGASGTAIFYYWSANAEL